jgi:hypothetical protein
MRHTRNSATMDATSTATALPPTDITVRQIAPHIAAALLVKPRAELTARQGEIVDALKAGCPGYAVMRSLMLAFRSIRDNPRADRRRARVAEPPRRCTGGSTAPRRVAPNGLIPRAQSSSTEGSVTSALLLSDPLWHLW